MEVWNFILSKLKAGARLQLLYVLDNEGSSPGRRGFKLAVSADGDACGTIGGGIMEHKLVEKAKAMLQEETDTVILQRQFHDKDHAKDQSGMVCNGSQLIAFIPLSAKDLATVEQIFKDQMQTIRLSPAGLGVSDTGEAGFQYQSDADWLYTEPLHVQPVIHIVGGGHVSLALSELMCFLGFFSKVYDDRPAVHTILQNFFANEKIIIPAYDQLGEYISSNPNHFAVIMTMGYRTDKIALQQLVNKDFRYLGMLGSEHKVDILRKELIDEGVAENLLQKVFMPIGLGIFSKTPQEIAVSIAAEIIREKNKHLPTGRQKDILL